MTTRNYCVEEVTETLQRSLRGAVHAKDAASRKERGGGFWRRLLALMGATRRD